MKKWFHLRVALALLGAIVFNLIIWPIYCCAGSPIRNSLTFSNHDNKLNLSVMDENPMSHQTTHNNDNNDDNDNNNDSSYEISTNNVANIFKNYHLRKSIESEEGVEEEEEEKEGRRFIQKNNDSKITSSIYDIFLINSERKMKDTSRTLMRNDRSANQFQMSGNNNNNKNNNRKINGTKRVKHNNSNRVKTSTLDRNERSANLSHITGSARKIQLYIKNRFLQLLPDGTVNGTTDDLSDYSKFLYLIQHDKCLFHSFSLYLPRKKTRLCYLHVKFI